MTTFLKKIRQKNEISQQFLAKKLGLSRPTYVQLETGKRKMLVKEAQELAKFFDMELEDFILEKEQKEIEVKIKKIHPRRTDSKESEKENSLRISIPQEKADKFKEVILYVLENIGARSNIGEAVICKLLYFIDFDYYEKYEEQLMGAIYIKNHHGPTPVAFPKIIKEMEKEGALKQVVKDYFQYKQKKYLPLRKADLSNFSAREKEMIDWEIQKFKDFNAIAMEDYSHKDVPWISAENLKPIDYEAVFYRTPEFSVRKYDDEL